jgi:hypothetical protein
MDAAQISQLRASGGNPLDLVPSYLRSLWLMKKGAPVRGAYVLAIPLLALTTLLLQLTSTVLVSDFSLGTLQGKQRHESLLYDFKYDFLWDGASDDFHGRWGINSTVRPKSMWQTSPLVCSAFGEFQETIDVPENVDDTGRLFRAFLPFPDAQSRQMISYYAGKALVLDVRVSCQRPQIENLVVVLDENFGYLLNGSYSSTEVLDRLVIPDHSIAFSCPVSPQINANTSSLNICQAPGGNYTDGKLVSEFRNVDAWLQAGKSYAPDADFSEGIVDGPYLIIKLTTDLGTSKGAVCPTTSGHGAKGTWTNITGIQAPNFAIINASISLCYPAL